MKRFITFLGLLAVVIWLGCEKQESPVSPPQDRQSQASTGNATMAKLKENVEAWKVKLEECVAALKIQAAQLRQRQLAKATAGGKITVPDDFPTIQAAVDVAAPGTKILVKDGIYNETVTVVTNNLTIRSAHVGRAHLLGSFQLEGIDQGKIEGFDITGSVDNLGGILLEGCSKVEIRENEVRGTEGSGGFGIVLSASENCLVKDNKVHDNHVPGIFLPAGISIRYGGAHLVKGNEVRANYFGIVVLEGLGGEVEPRSGKNVISANECTGNLFGIFLFKSHENELGDNECNANTQIGIFLFFDSDRNRIGSGNEANDNGEFGISLGSGCDNNTVKKNAAHGNGLCDAIDEGIGNSFVNNSFGSFNCP